LERYGAEYSSTLKLRGLYLPSLYLFNNKKRGEKTHPNLGHG